MKTNLLSMSVGLLVAAAALAEVRVQDVARLQGQRTNKLMGYGLVVGLNGTGDGEKYAPTMRALMRLHQRFHSPVIEVGEIRGNKSVALVAVEAQIPEFGAREGQSVDVVVSAIGSAKSLRGGQLLVTPLQYAMFDEQEAATQSVLALAGGRVSVPSELEPTRGVISQGAALEADFIYTFIENDRVTLVLDDAHAGWTWSQMIARAINHEHTGGLRPAAAGAAAADAGEEVAVAVDPRNVVVVIPGYERSNPAAFVSRVLQTSLFMLPSQQARVTINRTSKTVSFTGAVRVSPTTLAVPGLGNVTIGKPDKMPRPDAAAGEAPQASGEAATGPGSSPASAPSAVDFSEFLAALSGVKATPEQLIAAIESLQRAGSLHAQVQYE